METDIGLNTIPRAIIMKDIIGHKIHSIHCNQLTGKLMIALGPERKCIILKNIVTYYDTGIIGQTVTKFDFNPNLGVTFHHRISKNGLNSRDYFLFQILTKNGAFEAAIKTYDIGECDEDF